MSSKKDLTREILPRYLKGTKEEKTIILNEFCVNAGYNRKYAITKLGDYQKHPSAERELKPRKNRKSVYGTECVPPLKKIWEFLEYPCGERLQPQLPEIIPILEKFKELVLPAGIRKKLLSMSISTVDRLLRSCRKIRRRKYQCTTKPGTILKHQIPVRKELWPQDTKPGFCELDYVAHCGDTGAGEFVSTLTFTDIATTWTEHESVLGKNQIKTVSALENIQQRMPFVICGIDPDNDGVFINWILNKWCEDNSIFFTRSRAYKKNDNAHVEQKNWSTVRQVLGYQRIDTERQRKLMHELYAGPLRDWQNFFLPTLRLSEKERRGARVIKRHDRARTPYRRVLESPYVSQDKKDELTEYYNSLNPVLIKKQMNAIIQEVLKKR
jgi:hypothetical protein